MKHLLASVLLIAAFSVAPVFTIANADAFDDAMQAGNDAFADQNRNFATEVKKQDQAWQNYSDEINHAWQRYSSEIDAAWGDAAKKPTQKEWVDYSEQRDARTSIDFEQGKMQVDVILNQGETLDSPQVKARIKQRLEKVIVDSSSEDKTLQVSPPTSDVAIGAPDVPIYPLKNQLKLSNGAMVTKKNASEFSNEALAKQALNTNTIYTAEGEKVVVSIVVNLIPDHLRMRVRPYLPRAKEMSQRFGIPVSLILGIMQTESWFNPMAHNGIPAYGLMQLVPRSGALDAYEYVFKQKRLLPAEYLYNADNNIELGSAYLKLLQIRELRRINDSRTRMLCAIAAYNTGAGNVAKAFIPGSHNIRRASVIINTMTYEQVYQHLRIHLPAEETQRYVMKVRKYMKNYEGLDGV